ncbi:DrrA family ABC transporter ATP-binding protein [Mesoterricola silvestris]|nr:hypothetical protein [Mesoterricola silvestris]
MTMLITTHYMDEADFLCDRVAIVDHGALIAMDTPENLKRSVPEGTLVEASFVNVPDGWMDRLERLPGIRNLARVDTETVHFRTENGSKAITGLVELAVREGVELASIAVKPTTLDDVFVHFTGHVLDRSQGAPEGRRKEVA